ncbi:SusD/RagB family nutrient-binding outer membrane lipoprotein [Sphingobacterium yanglingense]|uniref:SusD-like starch-binding protein associating with outer membrane n=1 Tax=Sphingobacterium yanglingense TaxID=1437280 RepID=A0A4R6WIK9_9SPHI|nr:SusD/RagB family nutrient-binding outer membrane lipoprotein [Sphingobacterium yanglingense]TDQ75308.1 SusD-like starch-binding protein associating with outer membrane [Sphingobacterium yanglingense]
MKKIRNSFLVVLALITVSCSKQLDINTDPNNPAELESHILLPHMQKYLGYSLATAEGFSAATSAYMHQMVHYGDYDQYGASGSDFETSQGWQYSYRDVLTNANIIIKQETEDGNLVYVGIAKVMKAYTASVLVDLYGSIPYTEANQAAEGNRFPKYDNGKDVYAQIFSLLDDAIKDLENTDAPNDKMPKADDIIYGGDPELWVKAANSIKLKLLVQQRKIENVGAQVNALLTGGKLISSVENSFMVPFGKNDATDDRNPGFKEYYATQRTMHVSPWLYEIMSGYNNNILTGIEDPRIPYYFYNQMKASDLPNANVEYRDGAFVSKYFGSQGPKRGTNVQSLVTLFGIYPVGGKYDEGKGGSASASSGTGAAPYRMITYADILFLKAELMQEGIVGGSVADTLRKALNESMKMIDHVVSKNGSSQTIPKIATAPTAASYITNVITQFNGGNNAKKLEMIMTQKWLSSVGSSVDQYTDYRRTGYPVLFDPNAIGGTVTPPVGGNGGEDLPAVPVVANRKFPNSLPYNQDEVNRNPNTPKQKVDLNAEKVFWMP